MSLEGLVIIGFAFVIYSLWRILDKISDIKLQLSELPDNNLSQLAELIEKIDRLADEVNSFSDLKGDNLLDIKSSLEEINSTLSTFRSVDSVEIKNKLDALIDSVDNLDKTYDI